MILNHVRLIPAISGGIASEDGFVRISGGKLAEVSGLPYAGDEPAQDCGGKTLIPGLIDLHTHISMKAFPGGQVPDDPMAILSAYAAHVGHYLDSGFTTVRDCGSEQRAAVYVRDMIRQGTIEGPNVIACGNILSSSAIYPDGGAGCADGPYEMRRAANIEIAKGADFLKIYASGSAADPKGYPKYPIMFPDEMEAAVRVAEMHKTYVAAHCHADSAIRACIEAGVHTLEHATYMSEDTINLLLKERGSVLIPTLSACFVSQEDPEERAFWLARLTPLLELESAAMEKAYRAGVVIGFGTDSGASSKQYRQGIEFEYRKQYCHMSDYDLLLQATKTAAEIAYLDDTLGTLRPGLAADLVLCDGRPDEDISVLYKKPVSVWKDGKQVR